MKLPDHIPSSSTEARAIDVATHGLQCLMLAEWIIDNPREREQMRLELERHRAEIEKQMSWLVDRL